MLFGAYNIIFFSFIFFIVLLRFQNFFLKNGYPEDRKWLIILFRRVVFVTRYFGK